MPVAWNDLGADRFRAQSHPGADMVLDRRVDIGEGAHGAADRAGGDLIARTFQTRLAACHFGVEAGEGQAHRRGFGMDAVAAADPDGVLVFVGATFQCVQNLVHVGQQDVGGADKLDIQGRVQNIAAGHALMHETCLVAADMFGQMGQEGDDVMLGHRFDLVDTGDVEFDVLGTPDSIRIFARDHAQIGLSVAGMGLDLVPDAKLGLG